MKRIIFSMFLCSLINYSSAQNKAGYLGEKNMISVFTTSNFMTNKFANSFFLKGNLPYNNTFDQNNKHKKSVEIFRIDYRLSYQRIVSNHFAIGLEYAYEKVTANSYSVTIKPDEVFFDENYPYSSPVFNANSFLLTVELFDRNKIAGQGFSSTFGIGPKLYSFNTKQNYRLSESSPISEVQFYSTKLNYVAINAFFQLAYRVPITPFFSFEFGVRFHTGYVLSKNHNYTQPQAFDDIWPERYVYRKLRNLNVFNLASLKTGFVFNF